MSTGETPHPHTVGHVGAGTGDDDAGRLVVGGGVGVGAEVDAGDPVEGAGVPGTGAPVVGIVVVVGEPEVTGALLVTGNAHTHSARELCATSGLGTNRALLTSASPR